ncbi:virion core protein, T7 gp14 family [Cupriavidus sp. D39]|uniref:virion core protein, T7 gp14 family n=1 Tax=Cupriavidus sp. D39 TaxID=2997877 RepID=UPI002270728B|nr:hypothetical protein [Cupriavidus sp. D39]MCY0856442.1 hypothetical protein [Cupriavidus sp. D39]
MCEPVTIVAAATAIAGLAIQGESARKQTNAIQAAYDDNVVQTRNQQVEQDTQAKDQMSERARQAMIETGHLQALANESGTTGGSNDRVTNEANFSAGQDIAAIQGNSQAAQKQLAQAARSGYATAVSRQSQVQQPSLIGAGLQIAGTYVSQQAKVDQAKSAAVKGST